MDDNARWWHPEVFGRRRPNLIARARVKAAIRAHFESAGLVEVETPVLQVSPGNETHIAPFRTEIVGADGAARPLALHTSPEFACKKLLAAGVDRLFTIAPVFRNRERGPLHHPEFTLVEWYRVGATLDAIMADATSLLRAAATAAGARLFAWRGTTADPMAEPERVTVCDAFAGHAGVDLASMLPDAPDGFAQLAGATERRGLRVAADDTWSDLFSKLLSACVEPKLGIGRPTILERYPASEAALARSDPADPRFAARFELYCCGVELANAFLELTDPEEQRRRFVQAEAERQRIYGETCAIDDDFLDALGVMPAAAGAALGFDRLVMLATHATRIEDVLWAPVA